MPSIPLRPPGCAASLRPRDLRSGRCFAPAARCCRPQLGALALLSLHYVLMGVTTAAVVNALGMLQLIACLAFGTHPRLRYLGYGLAGLMVASSIVTWQGLASALSTGGNLVIAFGRLQVRADVMRMIVLAGTPFWILHDLLIESPVVLADVLSLAVGVVALVWRHSVDHAAARPSQTARGF